MLSTCICVIVISGLLGVNGYAQHPGAYSSPHYAKKHYSQSYDQPAPYNTRDYEKVYTLDAEKSKHHEIDLDLDQKGESSVDNRIESYAQNETHSGRSSGFMATASNFLTGRGGQMLADIAKELIARSTGATSQVLSLNLTNLVILVVLKALILAAGMFGAGAWHHGYARSLQDSDSAWIEERELSLWKGYLDGDGACLLRAACDNPDLSSKYASGGELLLTGAKMLNGIIPYDEQYEDVLKQMKDAYKWGSLGKDCDLKYKKCPENPQK